LVILFGLLNNQACAKRIKLIQITNNQLIKNYYNFLLFIIEQFMCESGQFGYFWAEEGLFPLSPSPRKEGSGCIDIMVYNFLSKRL